MSRGGASVALASHFCSFFILAIDTQSKSQAYKGPDLDRYMEFVNLWRPCVHDHQYVSPVSRATDPHAQSEIVDMYPPLDVTFVSQL